MTREKTKQADNTQYLSTDKINQTVNALAQDSEQFYDSALPGLVLDGESQGRIKVFQDEVTYEVFNDATGSYETVAEEQFETEEDIEAIFDRLEQVEEGELDLENMYESDLRYN